MGKTAFLDLRGKELSLVSFERNGKDTISEDVQSVSVGEGFSFSMGDAAAATEESHLSIPLELLNFRTLDMPFSDVERLREIIPMEIEGLTLGKSSDVVFDVHVLGEEDGKTRVLVVYINKNTIRQILKGLKTAGFDPKTVSSLELSSLIASSPSADILASKLFERIELTEDERLLAAASELNAPVINLRRGEFAYTADSEKVSRWIRISMVLAALFLFVLILDMSLLILTGRRGNSALKGEIRKTYVSLFPSETKISSELLQLKSHFRELKDKEATYIGASPLQTLLDLSRISSRGLAFSEVSIDRDVTLLKGECQSLSDVQRIKSDLEAVFSEVTVTDTKPSSQNKTIFSIAAKGRKS